MFLYKNRIREKEKKALLISQDDEQRILRLESRSNCENIRELEVYKNFDIELSTNLVERKEMARETLEYYNYSLEMGESVGDVQNVLMRLEPLYNEMEESTEFKSNADVFIFPLLQFPLAKVKDDESFFHEILPQFLELKDSSCTIATGYLNLTDNIKDLIKKSEETKFNLLTSSPTANGFFNGGRFKNMIPALYRNFELEVIDYKNVDLFEYERRGWTFHGKGLWFEEEKDSIPLTIIGSSNFGLRSSSRDSEFQLYCYSSCEFFQERLREERDHLLKHCSKVTREDILNDKNTRISIKSRLLSKILKSYM